MTAHSEFYKKLLPVILLTPFIIYIAILNYYAINAPYYDDFSVLLEPVIGIMSSPDWEQKITWLFKQNASHVPAITRLAILVQALYMNGINFKYTIVFGNLGLILTAVVLMMYFRKKYSAPLLALIPFPFLLLSLTHWESMDFVTPAWQMYWGACFFPVICFIAIIEGYAVTAALSFVIALFLSSGGLCLYPLITGFCLLNKRWLQACKFAVIAGIGLMLFFHFLPVQQGMTEPPDVLVILKFIPAFMGNIVSNGNWDLTPYQAIHTSIGAAVLLASIYAFVKLKDANLFRLVLVYVILLAGMAVYARGALYGYVPSRYATFPALAIACLCCHLLIQRLKQPAVADKVFVSSVLACSILLWLHSLYVCREPLEFNRKIRSEAIHGYAAGNTDILNNLLWSADYGDLQLKRAKELSIYVIEK